jgi:hypothetical protein
MTAVLFAARHSDDERRKLIYGGSIYVYPPSASAITLIEHARAMIEEVYGPDPCRAQYVLPVEEFSARGAALKPRIIHHPRTKTLIRQVVADAGCDFDDVYIDVPRLRLATSHGYLTSGVGFAFHPHRDTWWSAPLCQINWWMPIYDFAPDAGMAFHPEYFSVAVKNSSADFNYYRWNADGRKYAAKHVRQDTRVQPKPQEEIRLDPQIRPICPAGGVIMFAAAHLHSTVPNSSGLTRFSLDFRTVSRSDLEQRRAVPNLDSFPTGTSLRDFRRGSDAVQLPDDLIARYDSGDLDDGVLVFTPDPHEAAATVYAALPE